MDIRTAANIALIAATWLVLQICKATLSAAPLWLHAALTLVFLGSALALIGRGAFSRLGRPEGRTGYRITVGYFVVTCLLYMATHPNEWQWSLQNHFNAGFSTPEVAAVFTIVPFYEELFFRGAVQTWIFSRLEQRTPKAAAWSIYLGALLFWLFHAPSSPSLWANALAHGGVPLAPGPFFLGLACGWIMLKDRSLLFPIVLHGVANLLGPLWGDMLPPTLLGLFFSR